MATYYFSKSKRFAIGVFVSTFILSVYAIYKDMGEVVMAILPANTIASMTLYGNKQYQDRKKEEINAHE